MKGVRGSINRNEGAGHWCISRLAGVVVSSRRAGRPAGPWRRRLEWLGLHGALILSIGLGFSAAAVLPISGAAVVVIVIVAVVLLRRDMIPSVDPFREGALGR